jgi:intracellular multiplication protein IcmB
MSFTERFLVPIIDILSIFNGLHTHDYCQLDAAASKNDDRNFLCSDGSYLTGIHLEGINKTVLHNESLECRKVVTRALENLLKSGNHSIDWEFTKDPLSSKSHIKRYMSPMRDTARVIGLDYSDQFDAAEGALPNFIRPESVVVYIKTFPTALNDIKKYTAERMNVLKEGYLKDNRIKETQKPFFFSEELKNIHNSSVDNFYHTLKSNGYSLDILSLSKAGEAIKSSTCFAEQPGFKPVLWRGNFSTLRFSYDEKASDKNLYNLGAPSLGLQLFTNDIENSKTSGICKVGNLYVAPIILEMLPEDENANFAELLSSLPHHLPFKYRATIEKNEGFIHKISKSASNFLGFSQQYLETSFNIKRAFDQIKVNDKENITRATVKVICATWAPTEKKANQYRAELRTKLDAWGTPLCIYERGNSKEAIISTVAGYSDFNLAPATIETTYNISKLLPIERPASPFKDGTTPLRHPSGKMIPFSATSSALASFIEIYIASSGAGKSVAQNAENQDNALKPGNKRISRTTTIDIGSSGKGTVKSMQQALPEKDRHKALYHPLTLSKNNALNPFDLHLGAKTPTSLDRASIISLLRIITQPKDAKPARLMAELIEAAVDASYNQCEDPDTAKPYRKDRSKRVDAILATYPETYDDIWGLNKTWYKVRDFLFQKGHILEAKIAQRHAVPLITEMISYCQKDIGILNKYGESGLNIISEFSILLTNAAKNYPLITQPTSLELDDARYIVLDLKEVTKETGSQQSAFMYGLASLAGTKDMFLTADDLHLFGDIYQEYQEIEVSNTREDELSIIFEEFRRTKGNVLLRDFVERLMAEARKDDIRIQLVVQSPSHISAEMLEHASTLILMGTWSAGMVKDLTDKITLTASEIYALTEGVTHGPRAEGTCFMLKYKLKESGWASQIAMLSKSGYELWSSTTSNGDMILRDRLEERVGDFKMAKNILNVRYPSGSAKDEIRSEKEKSNTLATGSKDVYDLLCDKAIRSWKEVYSHMHENK